MTTTKKARIIGAAITILASLYTWYARKHLLNWFFTRIEVGTHPDCKPRYRTWKNGIEQ